MRKDNEELLTVGHAAGICGVSKGTLRKWADSGKVPFVTINSRGDRRFSPTALRAALSIPEPESSTTPSPTQAALYVRVSGSTGQESSLANQEAELQTATKDAGQEVVMVYKDKGSGLNTRRSGLNKLLKDAQAGQFGVVYVTHEDRLARFGVPWLRQLLQAYGVSLCVTSTNKKTEAETTSAQDELVADFIALVASFSGRIYGQRSAEAKAKLLARVTTSKGDASKGDASKSETSSAKTE